MDSLDFLLQIAGYSQTKPDLGTENKHHRCAKADIPPVLSIFKRYSEQRAVLKSC